MTDRPRGLDLFCKAGGATRGYQRAGFHMTGVDIEAQPHYVGDAFVQGDALEYVTAHGREYDFIHASPPCQAHVQWGNLNRERYGSTPEHPDVIAPTREALVATGRPYVIENVVGSPLRSPVMLCGSHFGLRVRRHRLFESPVFFRRWGLTG